jgi:hypothetical protein
MDDEKKIPLTPEEQALRDAVAIAAITGLALHELNHPEKVVVRAWRLAELMLLERARQQDNNE